MGRLEEAGLRLKREKRTFFADEVVYLGHKIDQHGLHPAEYKVEAIQKVMAPENVLELQAFLSLLNEYGRFLAQAAVQGSEVVLGFATAAESAAEFPKSERTPLVG